MRYFKCPSGSVKFKMGEFENLPFNAEEIKLYMVSGDPSIYIVPVSEIEGFQPSELKFDYINVSEYKKSEIDL